MPLDRAPILPYDLPSSWWWVFFVPATEHRRWWYRLIPSYRGCFQHVYACCEIKENLLLWVDPQLNVLVTSISFGRPKNHIRFVHKTGGRVLFVEFPADASGIRTDMQMERVFDRGLGITCASVVAYAMGLDTRAVTPRGLWRVLRSRYNAKEVERHVKRRLEKEQPS